MLPFRVGHALDFTRFFSDMASVELPPDWSAGADLADLLRPLDLATFIRRQFLTTAVLVRGEGVSKIPWFTLERYRALLRRSAAPPGFTLDAHFRGSSHNSLFEIERRQIGPILSAGATVCATSIDLIDSGLQDLTRHIKEELSFTGQVGVNCYLSAHGAGFPRHFDTKAVIIFQLEGLKNWRYEETPAVPFPRRAGRVTHLGVELNKAGAAAVDEWEVAAEPLVEAQEVQLLPGDILCLPPGAWHEAKAEGYSLALTVACQPLQVFSLFSHLLGQRLDSRREWRAGTPPSIGGCEDEVRHYFAERIQELKAEVANLDENDPALWDLWRSQIHKVARTRQT